MPWQAWIIKIIGENMASSISVKEIRPYVGVDDVKFSMSPAEVAAIWGVPSRISSNVLKERVEYRDGVVATFDPGQGLVELGFSRACSLLRLGQIEIFSDAWRDVYRALAIFGGNIYRDVGMVVFSGAGISLTGFGKEDAADLAATVFASGRWDSEFPDMKLVGIAQLVA